ncbi:MAG: choice-of-anchor D domain-containing protein [Myxococcota bacterium]
MRLTPLTLATSLALLATAACSGDGGFSLGSEASLDINPSVLEFGDVARGESALRVVTLRHVGREGVIHLNPVRLLGGSPDLSIDSIESVDLAPGAETRIRVKYTSGDDAPDVGELLIGLNIGATPEVRIPITTPGQRGRLIAVPGTLDFGVVQAGAPKTVTVGITNVGTAPAELTSAEGLGADAVDFSFAIPPGTVVNPGQRVEVEATYAPVGGGSDKGVMRINTDRPDVSVEIPVQGEEQTPILVVSPSIVQLGWIEPGGSHLVTVKMRNEGNVALTVNSIDLLDQVPSLVLANVPQQPFELEPEGEAKFGVFFSPLEEIPQTGQPLGRIVIGSTDEARNPLELPIYGAAGVPGVLVNPPDVVDFAYVAEGFKARRSVTVLNVGKATVTVTDAALQNPTSGEFAVGNPEALPAQLKPGETVALELTFENTKGDSGTEFAQFVIHTSDALVKEYPLDVVARRSERATCEPAFVPNILAMGAQAVGTKVQKQISVVNYGAGNCEYRSWELIGCDKVQQAVRHRFVCDPQQPGSAFAVVDAPAPGEKLGPGDSLTFGVEFTAPPVFNTVLGRDQYFAKMTALMHDPNSGLLKLVAPPGGWGKGYNLSGESALPLLAVDPPSINFGLVRRDCESAAQVVTITNLGPLAATVTGVSSPNCGGDMVVKNLPAFPLTVPGYERAYIEVAFTPTSGGAAQCQLVITTNAANLPEAAVDLSGDVVDFDHFVDSLVQQPTPRVDVLFVIDDSFSMADKQLLVSKELPKLIDVAATWGQDFHLAVTTTDDVKVRGKFKGTPPYTVTAGDLDLFAQFLLVGVTGSGEEKGLEGAWLAVSGSNVAETEIACVDKPNACPQGFRCIENLCRGANWGFLRPNADLVIIIISDEEDSSPQTPLWYVSHFAALKAPQSGHGVKMHAVVTTPEGCKSATFGTAGLRYIEAVKAFQGHVASICATDFAAEFDAIGDKTFGLKDQFLPSLPVEPSTLQVRVNGQACTTGWAWNPNTQAVVFDRDGPCFPPFDATVDIEYDVRCQTL